MANNSVLTSVTTNLEDANKNYDTIKGDGHLAESFHEAGRDITLTMEVYSLVITQSDERRLSKAGESIMRPLDTKTTQVKAIFQAVAMEKAPKRPEKYRKTLQWMGLQSSPVEALIAGIMQDVCNLARNSGIENLLTAEIKSLREAIEKLSKMESSVPEESNVMHFSSHDTSTQFNAPGGVQNNNTGNGNHFSGATFSGSVHFGQNPS